MIVFSTLLSTDELNLFLNPSFSKLPYIYVPRSAMYTPFQPMISNIWNVFSTAKIGLSETQVPDDDNPNDDRGSAFAALYISLSLNNPYYYKGVSRVCNSFPSIISDLVWYVESSLPACDSTASHISGSNLICQQIRNGRRHFDGTWRRCRSRAKQPPPLKFTVDRLDTHTQTFMAGVSRLSYFTTIPFLPFRRGDVGRPLLLGFFQ